jgi:RNA polymerase sigma-70 factor (ECF subfamily)
MSMRLTEATDPPDPIAGREEVSRLFLSHAPALRGFILAILPDFSLVDDVLQETFLEVNRKAAVFRPGSNFFAWVCTIARFKTLETIRRRARQMQVLDEAVIESLCACAPEELQPDDRLPVLKECLDTLAPKARKLVDYRYFQGHKPAEVARLMEWTHEAVYVALSRVRARLRECVNRRIALTAD